MAANWDITNTRWVEDDEGIKRISVAYWTVTDDETNFLMEGQCNFGEGDGAWETPYDELVKQQVIAWVKASLTGKKVAEIETTAAHWNNNGRGEGLPWATPTPTPAP